MSVNLKALIGKLNKPTQTLLNNAAGLALSNTHHNVEIEHFLMCALDREDGDIKRVLDAFEVDKSRLQSELRRSLDQLSRGNSRVPAISQTLAKMIREAWTIGSIEYESGQVRSGYCILALVEDGELKRLMEGASREFQKIDAAALRKDFSEITAESPEEAETATAAMAPAAGGAPGGKKGDGKTPNLDQFTVHLTGRARAGKIDPILGRDEEVRQMVDILTRRRQNNPILTGEAGVGKTAVVEGFAVRVAKGDVPPPLQKTEVYSLDLALLQAGAGIKGEFENRLKGLIEEVKSSATPIILFIDEAHTMIGAGGQQGQGDAANLLKPALARGELRTIAATTWSEYKKYFEKDPALSRRFQVVKVEEPSPEKCMTMMRGIVSFLEKHHNVQILDEGMEAAVNMSARYLTGRQLPDKAVSVLDTACARLALGQSAIPAAIEDLGRRIDDLVVQQRILKREEAAGADHGERLEAIEKLLDADRGELDGLKERYENEKGLVEKVRELREKLSAQAEGSAPADTPPRDEMTADLKTLEAELAELQGEAPMMRICVDATIVGEVISGWTGIPVGSMLKDEIQTVLELESHLGERVIGQDHSLAKIAQRIRTSRAAMDDPGKPIGVFMLVGPSGVGKTETAITLAEMLYGGERNMITINMSEFQEAHTVSSLKGSPPGYVGYGEGGVLTEAVRRKPYSVVLLDEVEKAHPDVLELFYQVFDKGRMEDGEGREIDFKNCVILLTSNAATETLMSLTADEDTMPDDEGLVTALKPELDKVFKPAFLGRMVIIPYFPLRDENLGKIVVLKLKKIQKRVKANHAIDLNWDGGLVKAVVDRCTEVESGARNVDNILTNTVLPAVSVELLGAMAEGKQIVGIDIGVGEDGDFTYTFKEGAPA